MDSGKSTATVVIFCCWFAPWQLLVRAANLISIVVNWLVTCDIIIIIIIIIIINKNLIFIFNIYIILD
jgi:hypothetical protein